MHVRVYVYVNVLAPVFVYMKLLVYVVFLPVYVRMPVS